MTPQQLYTAKEIEIEINGLVNHKKKLLAIKNLKGFSMSFINAETSNMISLQPHFIPNGISKFIDNYLINIDDKIKELEEEFNNL